MIGCESVDSIVDHLKLFLFFTAPKSTEEVKNLIHYQDVGTLIINQKHVRVSKYLSTEEYSKFIDVLEDLFSLTWVRRFWQKNGLAFEKCSEIRYRNRSSHYSWHVKWNGPFVVEERVWMEKFRSLCNRNFQRTTGAISIDEYSSPISSDHSDSISESATAGNSPLPTLSLSAEFEDDQFVGKKNISSESILNELEKEKERSRQLEKSRYYYKSKCKEMKKKLEELEQELLLLVSKNSQSTEVTGNHSPTFQTGTSEGTSEERDISSVDEHDIKESFKTILRGLLRDTESYFEDSSERTLSVRAGFHCLNLVTACKVSKRMIPQVVATVIHMLFGDVDSKLLTNIIKSWDT